MALLDFLKASEYKRQISELQKQADIKLSLKEQTSFDLENNITNKKSELSNLKEQINLSNSELAKLSKIINQSKNSIQSLKEQTNQLEDDLEMQSFGIYQPQYDFATSIGYKDKLTNIRSQQKNMIKNKQAVAVNPNWTVDGSKAKGRKMNNNNTKAILRSFNNECEAAINKVTYSNIERIKKRIQTSFSQHNKLNEVVNVRLLPEYLNLKILELHLAYEYSLKKQQEKEVLREQREREREEKALQKEISNQQKNIDKEISHYKNIIADLQEKLKIATDQEKKEINLKITELEHNISEHEASKKELDYRLKNATAGYVYIISNIGSFGKDVVKIGVTRRLDPLDRIYELSSASVPYKFDVHALIFSYDAYKLESNLHHKFDKQRINKVNNRKEFFKIPIDVIKATLEEYDDLTVDFEESPEADEYKQSLGISTVSN